MNVDEEISVYVEQIIAELPPLDEPSRERLVQIFATA